MTFDNNKLYASEILSILLQNEPDNRKSFVDMAGSPLDSMLQQLAYYKRHNPNTAEEQEMMENLFDCLCSLLLEVENRSGLVEMEDCQCFPLLPMVTLQHCGKSFHASLNFSWDPNYKWPQSQKNNHHFISGTASPTVVDACKRNVTTSNSNHNAILSESKSKSKHLSKSITLFLSLQNKVIIQELSC